MVHNLVPCIDISSASEEQPMRQFGCVSGHGSLQAGVWEIPDPQVYQVAIRLAPKQKSENGRECGSALTTISFLCGLSEPVFRRLSLRCMKATFRNWQTHDGDLVVAEHLSHLRHLAKEL